MPDLRYQSIQAGEAAFVAQARYEVERDARTVDIPVEVEQVCFDGGK